MNGLQSQDKIRDGEVFMSGAELSGRRTSEGVREKAVLADVGRYSTLADRRARTSRLSSEFRVAGAVLDAWSVVCDKQSG